MATHTVIGNTGRIVIQPAPAGAVQITIKGQTAADEIRTICLDPSAAVVVALAIEIEADRAQKQGWRAGRMAAMAEAEAARLSAEGGA